MTAKKNRPLARIVFTIAECRQRTRERRMSVNKEHKEFHTLDMGAGWESPAAGCPTGRDAMKIDRRFLVLVAVLRRGRGRHRHARGVGRQD